MDIEKSAEEMSDEQWVWQHFPRFYVIENQKGDHFAGFRSARYQAGAMRADGYGKTKSEMFSEARKTLAAVFPGLTSSASAKSEEKGEADNTYLKPKDGWVCFHCGERFTTPGAARDHFGATPEKAAGCIVKLGYERGLLMALRKSEERERVLVESINDAGFNVYIADKDGKTFLKPYSSSNGVPAVPAQGDGENCPTCAARGTSALYIPRAWHEAKLAAAQERIRELTTERGAVLEEAALALQALPFTQEVFLPNADDPTKLVRAMPRMTNPWDCAEAIRKLKSVDAALRTYADAKGEGNGN